MTEEMKAVSYCIGMSVAGSLKQQNLGEISHEVVSEAIKDTFEGKEMKYSQEEADGIIQKYLQTMMEKKFEGNKGISEGFLAENGQREEVQTTASGLQFEVITEAEGEKPGPTSHVTVHYHGTLIDGTVFDSSVDRGEPTSFGVNQVIPGWTEALQLMSKGSKYRLYIPQELAYGANPHPGGAIEPYMALVFDVELIEIA
ncbi:MAG: FKBP-type peptidyl-prolyl cis-trans isomerase [Crocinitomicaceae bacterium]|nr:FKBP-type peptidyl-prolyl cis-trans isomerase [Crocinitomicaceae bacterium]